MGLVDTDSLATNSAFALNPNQEDTSPMTLFRNNVSNQLRRLKQYPRLIAGLGIVAVGGASAAAGVAYTLNHPEPPLVPAATALSPQASLMAPSVAKASTGATHRSFNPLRGIASWYGSVLHGHTTASGEIFDESKMTACHNSLPFGTQVKVTDLTSNKSVVVRINDRGILSAGRVIDLSSAAAEKLGILRSGIARVKLEVLNTTRHEATGKSS